MNRGVLIGGNHLANVLICWLGDDFATKYPPTISREIARARMDGLAYDVWVCWAAIMRERDEESEVIAAMMRAK